MVAVGDKVTTKFGEELEVLDVKETPDVKKTSSTSKGKVTKIVKKGKTMFLAESGGSKCWFPLSYLKEDK